MNTTKNTEEVSSHPGEKRHWIKKWRRNTSCADFDAVVRDPVTLTNLLSRYNSGDGLSSIQRVIGRWQMQST
jgi:hypothetical protein